MEFEWDAEKERTNVAKLGLDFRTPARVFLDAFLLVSEDDRGYDEPQWNAIGDVDGRVMSSPTRCRSSLSNHLGARSNAP